MTLALFSAPSSNVCVLGVVPTPPSNSPRLQPSTLQFSPILTLCAWTWRQTPRGKGAVLQECPALLQRPVTSLGPSDPPAIKSEVLTTHPLGFDQFARGLTELRVALYLSY